MRRTTGCAVALILLTFLGGNIGCADDVKYWADTLQGNDLLTIAGIMEKESQSFPRILAVQSAAALSPEERESQRGAYSVAESLFTGIRDFERRTIGTDISTLTTAVETYGKIARVLRTRGGYVNYVLADTCYRLALSRLGAFLMRNPDKSEDVLKAWRQLSRPIFDVDTLAEILENEGRIKNAKNKLETAPKWSMLPDSTLRLIDDGTAAETRAREHNWTERTRTTYLLKEKDIRALCFRMMFTDLMAEVSIPGMLEFMRRGGKYRDFPSYEHDIRPLYDLMGESRKSLRPHFYGIREADFETLSFVLHEFGKDMETSIFYKNAVE